MKKALAVFVALLLVALVAVGVSAQSGSGGYYDFESSVRILQDLLVLDDVNIQDSLRVEGDVAVGDDLTITDAATLAKLSYTAGTTQTLTADATITTTNSYLLISAAGSIGTSNIGTCNLANQGQLLVLENVSNTTITITDTGTLKLSGNAALAQWDSAALICDGTNWVQLYEQDN